MRLYLSSFRLGNKPEQLANLAPTNKRAAVVLNACDLMSQEDRQTRLQQECTALHRLGFEAQELDLRDFFSEESRQEDGLRALLVRTGLIWIRGGNPFVLRRAMKQSGFDKIVISLLEQDALVYGGFSAAIAVLSPSLHGIELVDDPHAVPAGYDTAIEWSCLNVLPYAVAPHYRSDHPESAAIERVVQYYIDHHMLFKALRDGEVIIVSGGHEDIVS